MRTAVLIRPPEAHNASMLKLRVIRGEGSGSTMWTEPHQYEVVGLPPARSARIAKVAGAWKIMRSGNWKDIGKWTGSYATAEDALQALESEVHGSN